jgi:HD-GYP domain-containing protein (c-di-GMP phosphodiesterase class II)
MSVLTGTKILTDKYLAIYLESLRIDTILKFDLYIKQGSKFILFRSSNLPFTERSRAKLVENNVKRLYIGVGDSHTYQRYVETNIREILTDETIPDSAKAGIAYESAKLLVKDVLSKPNLGENIKRSQVMVEATVSFILKRRDAFHNLMQVMSFDYYTYTHSVNVCTFSLALAEYCGINDLAELNRLGCGALLHDVGKTKIDEAILNRPGALTADEMEIVKKHPEWGCEIIRETNLISDESYFPILQHHERIDKSGYPSGLAADEIHYFSKIVAIADVFDAMTTQRVYRSAVATYPALKTMFDLRNTFDENFLRQFTRLLGPTKLAAI